MTTTELSLIGSAHGNISACLDILARRASRGPKAKPTIAELNELLGRLTVAQSTLEAAAAASVAA